jgi:fatty acid desaturase
MTYSATYDIDVRTSMSSFCNTLPAPLYGLGQSILTWITGKSLPGQKAFLGGIPAWVHLSEVLFVLIGSATLSVVLWVTGGFYLILIPVTVGITLSASRTLWLMDLHAAAHGTFSRSPQVNRMVGDAVSLLLWVLPHSDYRRSHCVDHHSPKTFCSPDKDPDGSFLCWMDLRPGTPKEQLWRRLLLGLLSPRVHFVFLATRFKANLFSSGLSRSAASLSYLTLIVVLAERFGWATIFVSWLLPVVFLYQISAIVGWAGEHAWFEPMAGDLKEWSNARTHARFFGVPFPRAGSLASRCQWGARMIGKMILRVLFVPGDLPNHDWHHRHPSSRDWPRAAYARQAAIEAGESYPTETWGLLKAIDRGLSSIAAQNPAAQTLLSTKDAMTVFGTM